MTTRTHTVPAAAAKRRPRTVAVVSGRAHPHAVHEVLGAVDHDVVFVESIAHAYTQIKRVAPDLVIVCLSGEDEDGCQLLSMLALDNDTSRIPVLTHITAPSFASGCDASGSAEDVLGRFIPGSLN
jgi:CheY-like chemotaxis protein